MRKKKQLAILENVEIAAVAAEGKALARVDELVVFVPYVVPGDIVDLQLTRKKHHYAEAEAVRRHKDGAGRVVPFCRHYGVCGGCKWQCLDYAHQIRWKQQQVEDALTRIAKVELPDISPIMGSAKTREYRNKLEFGFSDKRWLTREQISSGETFEQGGVGFHPQGSFDKILPIEECHLMDGINNRVRNFVRDYAREHALSFYNARSHEGLLRGMMLRLSNTEEVMLVMQFCLGESEAEAEKDGGGIGDREAAMKLMQAIHEEFPEISSLLWLDNQKLNDTWADLEVHTYSGTDHIFLKMDDLRFKVGPKSFYQTNTEQARVLYGVARDFAGLTGSELVYDLYTGTGTIANFVAREARQVIGIEYVPEAIEDAKVNSEINGIGNTLFYAGDMKDILTQEFISRHGAPDVIITDPPRAGMHDDVIKTILFAAPKRIVYVSCNPATQARDLALLDADYKVERVQPVDMFPHTHHVENVVLLVRRP